MSRRPFPLLLIAWLALALLPGQLRTQAQSGVDTSLLSRSNLVAWCIVPFDTRKRSPEQRAEMLAKLGVRRFAYDWRAEHIPTFDAEIAALKRHEIELTAWWFPAQLNQEALAILLALKRNQVSPQLWVTLGTEPETNPRRLGEKMAAALASLEQICAAAREIGSTVGLYNHLGWFGEPPNQVALIKRLHAAGHTNVGIVYNFHHAHAHIDRFPNLLWLMRPYLLAVNLNGMVRGGDLEGRKIIPLGTGTEELSMLRTLLSSGWRGPVGILGHTDEDAEWKLQQELQGLDTLIPRLAAPSSAFPPSNAPRLVGASLPSSPPPQSTPPPPPQPASIASGPRGGVLPQLGPAIVQGRHGSALDARVRQLVTAGTTELRAPPILIEAWVRTENSESFQIIAASEAKASPTHWELYTFAGQGDLAFFSPGISPSEIRSGVPVTDGAWHHVAAWMDLTEVVLFVDGREAKRAPIQRKVLPLPRGAQLAIGRLVEGGLICRGLIESVRLSNALRSGPDFGKAPLTADASTLALWTFESDNDLEGWAALAATVPEQGPSQSIAPPAPPTSTSTSTANTSSSRLGTGINREEPWLQTEDNWVDDRWNRAVPGRWQAYTFPTPQGNVRKGLAVRLGSPADSAVAYDLASGQWRHVWKSGFLTFDAARFGLLNPPKPAGTTLLSLSEKARWTGGPYHWRGFAVSESHLVLEYSVGDLAIRESPDALMAVDATVLVRDFEFGPHADFKASLPLLEGNGTRISEGAVADHKYFAAGDASLLRAVALTGDSRAQLVRLADQSIALEVEPHPARSRARVFYFIGPAKSLNQLGTALELERQPANLAERVLSASGPKTEPIPVKGQLGSTSEAYAIDTIPMPYENPWNALMFGSGVGFFSNGDAAVSTIHGDVWRVSGLDGALTRVEWLRIASGLFQPLGLTVVSNQVHVLCRDQIVRLQDLDGDRITDYYEAFSTLIDTSAGGHDYVTSLACDAAGNFYYVDPKGAHRISPDGRSKHTIAAGFRNPNGMGVHPDGTIVTVAPQQGSWTPSSVIHELRDGGWYGYPGPKVTAERPLGYDLPLCWIPHRIDNSSGSQIWAPTSDRFGPLSGQMLHLSWGRCTLLLALRDVVDGTAQGAVFPLKGRFLSGPMRAEFNPVDGQLYVVGAQGWQTAAARDGSFQRVRWTGRSMALPVGWKARPGRLEIRFNELLDPETATDPDSYAIEAWNYRYADQYGSKDWSVAHPDREGHDTWEVRAASWDAATRTVTLDVPSLAPVMQFSLRYNIDGVAGRPATGDLYGTIHRLHTQ